MALGQRTNLQVGGTAARILEHARRAFNERGVANVGVRDIARELDLSPGNVSYHFATKEALIEALIEEGHEQNNRLFALPDKLDFATVDRIIRTILQRDLDHRWLLRDIAGLIHGMPALRPLNAKMQRVREARVDTLVHGLVAAGLLDEARVAPALTYLRQQVVMCVMFALAYAVVAAPERDLASRLDHNAKTVLALFAGYCTPAGKRQLAPLL